MKNLIFESKIYELVSIIKDTDRFRIEKNKMRFFLWRETLLWISRKRLPRWPVYTQNWAYLPSLQESGTRERDQTHIGEKENFCLRAHDGLMCCMLRATKSFFYIEVIQHLLRDAWKLHFYRKINISDVNWTSIFHILGFYIDSYRWHKIPIFK